MFVGSCFITLWENPRVSQLSLNEDLFLRIAHPKSRGGRGEVNVRNLLRPWCVFYIPQSQNN